MSKRTGGLVIDGDRGGEGTRTRRRFWTLSKTRRVRVVQKSIRSDPNTAKPSSETGAQWEEGERERNLYVQDTTWPAAYESVRRGLNDIYILQVWSLGYAARFCGFSYRLFVFAASRIRHHRVGRMDVDMFSKGVIRVSGMLRFW